jgi:hypothetical protein
MVMYVAYMTNENLDIPLRSGNTKERDQFGDLVTDGMAILKWILDKYSLSSRPNLTKSNKNQSRDSSVGTVTCNGLKGWGSIPRTGKRFLFYAQSSYRLWGPSNLLSSEYWELLPRGKAARTRS